jgi:hypothetical protein
MTKEKYSLEEAARLAIALGATCYVGGPSWYWFYSDETEEDNCLLEYDVTGKEIYTSSKFINRSARREPITAVLKELNT